MAVSVGSCECSGWAEAGFETAAAIFAARHAHTSSARQTALKKSNGVDRAAACDANEAHDGIFFFSKEITDLLSQFQLTVAYAVTECAKKNRTVAEKYRYRVRGNRTLEQPRRPTGVATDDYSRAPLASWTATDWLGPSVNAGGEPEMETEKCAQSTAQGTMCNNGIRGL